MENTTNCLWTNNKDCDAFHQVEHDGIERRSDNEVDVLWKCFRIWEVDVIRVDQRYKSLENDRCNDSL